MPTLSEETKKPPAPEAPKPPPPKEPESYAAAFGSTNAPPRAAGGPTSAPAPTELVQEPAAWSKEIAAEHRAGKNEIEAVRAEMWFAVASTPAVNAWKGSAQVTRREFDAGIKAAQDHCPAEHATRKTGVR